MVSFIRANQIFLIRLMKEHKKHNKENLTNLTDFFGTTLKYSDKVVLYYQECKW